MSVSLINLIFVYLFGVSYVTVALSRQRLFAPATLMTGGAGLPWSHRVAVHRLRPDRAASSPCDCGGASRDCVAVHRAPTRPCDVLPSRHCWQRCRQLLPSASSVGTCRRLHHGSRGAGEAATVHCGNHPSRRGRALPCQGRRA